jgi:hypothetical protein
VTPNSSVERATSGKARSPAAAGPVQAHPGADTFELTTNTVVPGTVAFYERRGYKVNELTRYTDKIV